MKKLPQLFFIAILLSMLGIAACEPPDDQPEPVLGTVKLNFVNMANGETFSLDDDTIQNAAGNHYVITKLLYYISNIAFTGCECGPYNENESYHLIKYEDNPIQGGLINENSLKLDSVQVGTYDGIAFSVGVDPVRNSSGAMVGALDPIHGMFWGWQSGYIFYKIEGDYIKNNGEKGTVIFHIGGDGAYREIALSADPFEVKEGETTEIDVYVEHNGTFGAPNPIDFNEFSGTMEPGEKANEVADKYATIFSLSKP